MNIKEKKSLAAKVAHEVNRAYCEFMEDFSQESWENIPDWQKKSIEIGINALINNPNLTPKEMHQKWYEHKVSEGWKYNDVRSATNKGHPCMLPYDQLPYEQKLKDYLFSAVVKNILNISEETTKS